MTTPDIIYGGQNVCSDMVFQQPQGSSVNDIGHHVSQESSNGLKEAGQAEENQEEVDISISNVVCSFATRCHLNLKKIALEGANVEYKREQGMLTMKLRQPRTTASMWSSGKITCTGATSEEDSKIAARRFARRLQKIGFKIRFCNFRVVNVLGSCSLPFGINIIEFSREHRENASYEPELHPGVTYRIKSPKATLKIFSTGSITVTAPSVANVQAAIEHIHPLVSQFKTAKVQKTKKENNTKFVKKQSGYSNYYVRTYNSLEELGSDSSDFDDEDTDFSDSFDSEESRD